MKFGVREICDVVFKAKATQKIGNDTFVKDQPVLYIDTAKTSTLEGAATTVYAQGGKGNTRLIAWEGEKTLTFTVEDALLSPIGFSVLSGAGLINTEKGKKALHVHTTSRVPAVTENEIDLTEALDGAVLCENTAIFGMKLNSVGDVIANLGKATVTGNVLTFDGKEIAEGDIVLVDYYVTKDEGIQQLEIDANNFAGYYYVEASTLFRRQSDGQDMPAEIIIPNVKIQSNFTFSMAATGDPSTFTFTMDAFPDYTKFDRTKKVLCAIQIIGEDTTSEADDVACSGDEAFQ